MNLARIVVVIDTVRVLLYLHHILLCLRVVLIRFDKYELTVFDKLILVTLNRNVVDYLVEVSHLSYQFDEVSLLV